MDVRLSAEQRALRDSATQLVSRLGPESVAALDDTTRRARLESAVAESGWRGLREPDDDGHPLASAVEVAIVAEELARGAADVAFLGPILAAELRRSAGAPSSEEPETVVLSADLGALGDEIGLDSDGTAVGLVLRDGRLGQVGLDKPFLDPVDLTRALSPVTGPHVEVGPAPVDLTGWKAFALAVTSAELVGTMRGALELSVAYARDRRQYGAAIGSFQAVQHLLADAHVAMEGSRSVALHAAWAVDAVDPAEALTAASVAKAYCSRAARNVCETAIQVHGGIGNTWECLAHVHLRRALLSTDVLGGVGPSLRHVLAAHEIGPSDGLR